MEENNRALILADEIALPVSVIRDLGRERVSEDSVIVTQCGALGGMLPFESASFGSAIAISKSMHFGEQCFGEFYRVLKSNGEFLIHISLLSTERDKKKSDLESQLLKSGFIEVGTLEMKSLVHYNDNESITIKGKKASWEIGSSFPLNNSKKIEKKILPKIQIQIDEESDIIDDDSLLTDDDLKKPQPAIGGDCKTGKARKTCKNCTCGRAETEAKSQKLDFSHLTMDQINNPQSACGSCGLGDAFRCGGCPYRGLPPFKLGEKVSLPGNFLVSDI